MTQNIVDIIKEQTMNQPTPTEKAQIVITCTNGVGVIVRYNSTKKAEKEYKAFMKAWKDNATTFKVYDIAGDMFDASVELSSVLIVSYVDIAKRAKFVPFQG